MNENTPFRDDQFRTNVLTHLGYHVPRKGRQIFKCMLSREDGDGDEVVVAHIVSASSSVRILNLIRMTEADVNSLRNGLLLAKNFEVAFNRLQLSFVKSNPLSQNLYLQIWDDSCRNEPIYDGSTRTIGDFEGEVLNLGSHRPFRRALSFQAYQAFLQSKDISKFEELSEDGSEKVTKYFEQQMLMKDSVLRDIQEELEDDRSMSET